MPGEPVVEAAGLNVRIGDFPVLTDIDLTIRKGEKIVLIGPSGSGKTSLLRVCAGLLSDRSGRFELFGSVPATPGQWSKARRRMAMIFQSFNLYSMRTALDNITFAARELRLGSEAELNERGRDLLELVGCHGLADRYPFEMSGGQQQRIAIARALIGDPELLLLDEPTASLDPETIAGILDLLTQVAEGRFSGRPMTVLCATHEMGFARRIADRVLFMEKGYVVASGTSRQMFGGGVSDRFLEFVGAMAHQRP
ncbi:MAG: amino acid ABC transporter ATP-binding protein [Roseitalea sp.]|jgi:ABC-type polar amino acid transport system ATPase subunit|uniref:Amino acid ABC transporter ATP-binding protein n=1 Tax=Oceaniradius stylonematis TaxID=2184161 RepID=A0A3A8ADU7_9HYPH|nr:ATP-binding cassette domain-containing protein [Oceaniradius stylonematis]MBO6554368.1 amino acid ABC transporter ATP-binding protein [Roseitalea sp.]MBO6953471.1 amino acid ABC transporter ATP-binding protein [Rhizobiaceae bacterium]RNC96898.1 MAG: amino acid ABC transporter ATP-binding protein [Oricola sp.]MBO6593760.1 amino acid ABC transporter ATP-binding protein [Roseitalea sp.]MBO6601215.1 amino acid ABC transporter ATP-binding protein [Roseitalea sp.]